MGVNRNKVLGDNVRVAFARLSLHWGFSIRFFEATAAQLALSLVPPTTVVGAFTAPFFKLLGLRDVTKRRARGKSQTLSPLFDCALGATLAATMGLPPQETTDSTHGVGICTHQEPSRIISAPYRAGGSWEKALKATFGSLEFYGELLTQALPVQAVGVAYGPSVLVDLIWVFDVSKIASCLGVDAGKVDFIGKIAVYGVSRIGSKEGVVSVEDAKYLVKGFRIAGIGDTIRSYTYVPVECVEKIRGEVDRVTLWDLRYETREYYVPSPSSNTIAIAIPKGRIPEYRITGENCKAYIIDVEEGVEGVAVGVS